MTVIAKTGKEDRSLNRIGIKVTWVKVLADEGREVLTRYRKIIIVIIIIIIQLS